MDRCTREHPQCIKGQMEKQSLPTRLLYLGSLTSDRVHLVLTDETWPSVPYATLSHCWGTGTANPFRLTRETMPRFMEGLDTSSLPATFRDAVVATKKLELVYLWIDSLCIIQGDEADWQVESSKMHAVYGNGFCNIAAAGAMNTQGGLFQHREVSQVRPCMIWARIGKIEEQGYVVLCKDTWTSNFTESPLLRRGWVVQERILSRRMIHFGRGQLYWECLELSACEQFPEGFPSFLNSELDKATLYRDISYQERWQIASPGAEKEAFERYLGKRQYNALKLWSIVVSWYTKCQLTMERDKLIAISGLAKHISRFIDGQYIAGLWLMNDPKLSVSHQLLWEVEQRDVVSEQKTKYPANNRAPSWSWAAIDGPVNMSVIKGISPFIRLVQNPKMVLKNENDPMGEVISGALHIRGCLIPVRMKDLLVDSRGKEVTLDLGGVKYTGGVYFTFDVDDPDIKRANSIFLLPISGSASYLYGLVVRQRAPSGPRENHVPRYERLGVFNVLSSSARAIRFAVMTNGLHNWVSRRRFAHKSRSQEQSAEGNRALREGQLAPGELLLV